MLETHLDGKNPEKLPVVVCLTMSIFDCVHLVVCVCGGGGGRGGVATSGEALCGSHR